MCKLHQNSKKKVMMDILPIDICCRVSEYFGCCRCEWLMEKENEFMKEEQNEKNILGRKKIKSLTKGEKQILFFTMYKDTPIKLRKAYELMDGMEQQNMKKEIEIMYRSYKKEYADANLKMRRLAIISLMKKNTPLVNQIISDCYWPELLSDNIRMFCMFGSNQFSFRNQEFDRRDLIEDFVINYVKQLIGTHKGYCDIDSINDWCERFCMAHIYP